MRRSALTLVEVLVVIAIIGLLIALLLPAAQAARESSRRVKCTSNLRQVALALTSYHDVHGVLPDCSNYNYSFLVTLLPYAEQESLYRSFDFRINALDYEGPLDSARVSTFECPSDGSRFHDGDRTWAAGNYHANCGSGAQRYGFNGVIAYTRHPLGWIHHVSFESISDGLSQTALLSEVAAGDRSTSVRRCVWNLPGSHSAEEFEAFASECRLAPDSAPPMTGVPRGRPWSEVSAFWMLYNHALPPNSPSCYASMNAAHSIFSTSSMHGSIVNLARADGSVASMNEDVDLQVWRKLGSRAGNP